MLKIYHNPRCRKSRETLQIIEDSKTEVEIIEYLKDVPTREELQVVLDKLMLKPSDILRKNEAIFKENYKGKELNEDEWLNVLIENPKLIERPIVFDEKRAVIGRPPENVREML